MAGFLRDLLVGLLAGAAVYFVLILLGVSFAWTVGSMVVIFIVGGLRTDRANKKAYERNVS